MTTKITSDAFSGAKAVHDGTLAAAIRAILQREAFGLAIALSDFTADNSTGTDGSGTVANIPIPAAYTSAGTDLAPKAGTETALGTLKNAIAVVLEKANAVATATGVPTKTDSTGGTIATSGTIPAVTKLTTAVATGSGVAHATGKPVYAAFKKALHNLALFTNELAVACGQSEMAINIDSAGDYTLDTRSFPALSTNTGTAEDGSALSGVADTASEAFLAAGANAIATIAGKLDALTGGTLGAPQAYAG